MVQIGTIEYEARVTGVAEAKKNAQEFADTQYEAADASEEAASSGGILAGTLSTLSGETEEAGRESDRAAGRSRILSSALFFLTGTAGGAIAKMTGLAGAIALAKKGAALLTGVLSLSGLAGAFATLQGLGAGFVSWLAAGSVGALAFGAAIGAGIGYLGAWILHVTGALDAIGNFGAFVRDVAPDWVADGILQILSVTVGPLAALGGFIIGTFEGGFSEGVARAQEVVDIFVGSWQRQIDRVVGIADDAWSRIRTGASDLRDRVESIFGDIGGAIEGKVRSGFNAAVPSSVDIPSVTLSAPDWAGGMSTTIGGQSLDLPQLDVGGRIQEDGAAVVHKGEAVIPEPIVSAAERAEGGGGGGGGGVIENLTIELNGEFDPTNVTRRDLEELARKVDDVLGGRTNRRAGTR